ncbi:MAG: sigma 54-interacting transcriptional regulator [Pseudomonadota bacterium]
MHLAVAQLELKVLFEISRIIGQALDLDRSLERVLEVLSESMAMKRATLTLLDEETGVLGIRASHGLSPEERRRGVYRTNEGVTGRIFQTAEPFYVPDISKEPLFLNKTQARPRDKSGIAFVGVPILVQGLTVGVLTVDRLFGEEISFEEDIRFLTIVAQLVSQFINLHRQVLAREDALKRRARLLELEMKERYNNFFIVGQSDAMCELQRLISRVAPSRASVLLLGESGTGKTLVARVLHNVSERANAPFVKINCAALPENLLESELFGHERGAFTGAAATKRGRVEEAHGGTIFLDEIGELPLTLQAKLLRFLQDREFERLGSTVTRQVDVRIIAATNADLARAVEEGRFREDLYYRLNVFPIKIPPLRERRQDIPLLIEHFMGKFSREYARRLAMDAEAMDWLQNYEWPGNVREMENLVERLAIMSDGGAIGLDSLPHRLCPDRPATARPSAAAGVSLDEMVRRELLAALERSGWVQSRAARELGITLRQLNYRLEKFGLTELVRTNRQKTAALGRV